MNNDTQPLVEPAPDAFPLHYRSPYIPGPGHQPVSEQPPAPEQPLLVDDPLQTEEQQEQAKKAWNDLLHHPLVQAFRAAHEEANQHVHGPFMFLLNQNHNALRGCVTCGAAWVGVMAGSPADIRWHVVAEVPEEEG